MTNAICLQASASFPGAAPARSGAHPFGPVAAFAPGGSAFGPETLRHAGARVWATLTEWQRRASARKRLGELDNRLLADVGLTRNDVRAAIEKPFWTA